MKKRAIYTLLIFLSAIIISACSKSEKVVIDDVDNTSEEEIITVTEESTTDSFADSNKNAYEIDYNWYEGRFYKNINDNRFWINLANIDEGIRVTIPGYTFLVDEPELINSEEYGTSLRYIYREENGRFDFFIDYMVESDEIILLYTNYTLASSDSADYSGVYLYDQGLSSTMKNELNEEYDTTTLEFTDGQRFECFETASGEDIILTIHLFTDENGNTTIYKGELSNGIEFWFEYKSKDTDVIVYNIDYAGEMAELLYYPNSSEIYLMTNGNGLNDYGGIYIGLPDVREE